MKLRLHESEVIKILHAIFCDGLYYMRSYGFEMEYSNADYEEAKAKLENPCIEDVQIQMLKDGKGITFRDNDGEFTRTLTLKSAKKNARFISARNAANILDGDYDAGDADIALQQILFKEIVFG